MSTETDPTDEPAEVLLEIGRGLRAVHDGDDPAAVYMWVAPLMQRVFAQLAALEAERDRVAALCDKLAGGYAVSYASDTQFMRGKQQAAKTIRAALLPLGPNNSPDMLGDTADALTSLPLGTPKPTDHRAAIAEAFEDAASEFDDADADETEQAIGAWLSRRSSELYEAVEFGPLGTPKPTEASRWPFGTGDV